MQTVRDGSQLELVKYTYLKDGKVDFQDYANGVRSDFGYNGRGMIDLVHHKRNATGANLSYREYWRDERDRITAWKRSTDYGLNGMEDGRGDRYHYDAEGQLEQASYRAVDPAGTATQAKRSDIFHYDALGNREGSNYLASRGTISFPRRNNGLNQYAGWMPFAPLIYDDPAPPERGNGVLTENGGITATYNALNQPMGMWGPAYGTNYLWFGYDPLGRCVKRWVSPAVGTPPNQQAPPPSTNPATYYYYEGWNLIQEGSSAAAADRTYVHGGRVDEIVASQIGGVWNYHQYDARGHCTLLTDTSGGIREQYDYDAFGIPYFYNAAGTKLLGGAQWGNRFLFTGREWLKELGVYDYRARMYHPELGRFLQPDPMHFGAGDYNLYRYCHNDPVNKRDPMGLFSPEAHDAIFEYALRGYIPDAHVDMLKEVSRNFDARTAMDSSMTNAHGMRESGQSVVAAKVAIDKFINDRVDAAKAQADAGRKAGALGPLGEAMHAKQDTASPMHSDKDGNPKVWNPKNPLNWKNNAAHSPNERWGGETKKALTPQILESQREQLRKMYDRVYGR